MITDLIYGEINSRRISLNKPAVGGNQQQKSSAIMTQEKQSASKLIEKKEKPTERPRV